MPKFDYCILTEKPSQAKNYATALGGQTGAFPQGPLKGKSYIIVNAVGHIYKLKDSSLQVDKPYQDVFGMPWALETMPWDHTLVKWLRTPDKDKKDIIKKIDDAISKSENVIIATDNDSGDASGFGATYEGDLLAFEPILELGYNKQKHFYRSRHHDETKKEILKAVDNLVDYGTDLTALKEYKVSMFRQKYDWLLGLQETRAFTKVAGDNLLRQGRLKSLILRLVYDQQQLIDNYVEIPYWAPKFKDENGIEYSSSKVAKEDDPSKVDLTLYHPTDVILDSEVLKYKQPPLFATLDKIAAALSGSFSGKQVESEYQKLYNDGYLSYPRTTCKKITSSEFTDFVKIADDVATAIGVDPKILTHKAQRPSHIETGNVAHGANHPLKAPSSLSEIESNYGKCAAKIYEYCARASLVMLCEDYEYKLQSGHLKDFPDFKGSKQLPFSLGWREIYDDDDIIDSAVGLGKVAEPFLYQGVLNPKPEKITRRWLVKELEKYGCGTGATRLSTINELVDQSTRNVPLEENKGSISLTSFGQLSGVLLQNTKVSEVDFTNSFYNKMQDVYNDANKENLYLSEIKDIINKDILTIQANASKINLVDYTGSENGVPVGKCPCCEKEGREGEIFQKTTKYGRQIFICGNNVKDAPDSCKFALYNPHKYFNDKIPLSAIKVKKLLEGKTISAKLKAQSGKSYSWDMKLVINEAGYPQFEKVGFTTKK